MEDGEANPPEQSAVASSSAVSSLHVNAEAGPSRPRQPARQQTKRKRNPYEVRETRWYSSDLSAHARSSRSLLDGRSKPFKHGVVKDSDFLTGLRRSIVPPATVWEVDEKCRFFAALSRHSRLRPELIASDVRTKNVMQVQQYLALLEDAEPPAQEAGPEARAYRDRHLRSGAYEGNEAWIEREEEYAATIERAREHALLTKPLRGQHAFVKWGHNLTIDKMSLLHRISCAAEEWPDNDSQAREEAIDTEDPIKADDREISMLEDVPKQDRSPADRQRLTTLKNRRRNRQDYRRKQLHNAGYTDEMIDAHGGPDEFLRKIGFNSTAGARRKFREHSPDTQAMIDLNLDGYLTRRGWELFNFERMGEAMDIYHSDDSSVKPSTSFDMIGDLFAEILAYIRQLVYTTLVLAEQEPHGHPPLVEEATADHVHAALALRGAPPPTSTLNRAVRRFSEGSSRAMELDDPPDPSVTGTPSHISTRGSEGPQTRAPETIARHSSSIPEDLSSWQSLEKPLYVPEEDADENLYRETETDREDEELDQALEQADTALDAVMNAQLKAAAKLNDKQVVIDDQDWFDVYRGRGNPREEDRNKSPVPVPREAVRALRAAQNNYTNLVETCLLARRKRSIARERTERYPWYQGYLKGGRLRNKKSLVEVSKSDVEDDLSDDEDAMASEGASDEWDSNANRGSDGRDVSGNDSGEQSADSDAPDPMLNEVSDSESGLKAIKQEAMSSYTMAGDGKVSEEASPYEIVKREAFGEERGSSQEGQSDVDEVGDAPLSAFTPNDVVLVGDDALDSDSD